MHKIPFPLGLRPRSRWGSLQHPPDPVALFKEVYFYKGKRGNGRVG